MRVQLRARGRPRAPRLDDSLKKCVVECDLHMINLKRRPAPISSAVTRARYIPTLIISAALHVMKFTL